MINFPKITTRKKNVFIASFLALVLVFSTWSLVVNYKNNQKSREYLSANISDFFKLIKLRLSPKVENPIVETSVSYSPTDSYENAVIQTVEKASSSVVSVIVSEDVPIIENCRIDSPFQGLIGGGSYFYVPCKSPSGKTKHQEVGGGTGFIVGGDGLILTNKHVVSRSGATYTVFLKNGKKYDAKIVSKDGGQDLALLKIEAPNLSVLSLGNSDSIRLGQTAIAIGNALGEYQNTVSVGVISGKDRSVTAIGDIGVETIDGVIQTDAAINLGNSGGPLLNLKGEVIGVNSAVASNAQSIGFAIPINKASRLISSYRKDGKEPEIAFLGVHYQMTDKGALISHDSSGPAIVSGSPANKAGLKEGDIIIAVNGKDISKVSLGTIISGKNPGDTITLKILRGGKTLEITVLLASKKEEMKK